MLLLYLTPFLKNWRKCKFTFHYASTLSVVVIFHDPFVPHLHSTMLLLYQISQNAYYVRIAIYIPLCFYFINPICSASEEFTVIYIPLCFYFIGDNGVILDGKKVEFTFHYASTLSDSSISSTKRRS